MNLSNFVPPTNIDSFSCQQEYLLGSLSLLSCLFWIVQQCCRVSSSLWAG